MSDQLRRLGRFTLPMYLLRQDPIAARVVMGECIIMKADYDPVNDVMEYLARSPQFAELSKGPYAVAPVYNWEIYKTAAGKVSATALCGGVYVGEKRE